MVVDYCRPAVKNEMCIYIKCYIGLFWRYGHTPFVSLSEESDRSPLLEKMPSTMSSISSSRGGSFEEYYQGWISRQEQFLNELVAARDSSSEFHDNDLRDLINRVRSHYEEYFAEKSRVANTNVFRMFSPTWFTPLERSYLWIGGYKPGLACRLATTAAAATEDLTEEQTEIIRQISNETKRHERALDDEMAKIQENVAAPPLMDLARSVGQHPQPFHHREIEEVDTMIESLKSSMINVLSDADQLRTRTVERLVEILSPVQTVCFFAAAAELVMRIRNIGLQKEADRAHTSINNGC